MRIGAENKHGGGNAYVADRRCI